MRFSLLAQLCAVPFVAFFLSGCSKEGEVINPKIKDDAPKLKTFTPAGPEGKGGDKGLKPIPD